MDKKINENRSKYAIPGIRYIFALNGMLGFCVIFALRVNINVAIVAMVNSTAVYHKDNKSTADECKIFPDTNTTNSSDPNPTEEGEFIWTPKMQGIILGAFYYGYCVSQIPGGRLAEIFSGKWVFGIGTLINALLTLLTPLAARYHVGVLIFVRALEGLAQGVTMPAMNFLLGRWLPDSEKSFLNAVIHSGINIGTVSAMPLAGFLCDSDIFGGWPSAFYVIGLFGCFWFILWSLFVTDSPLTHPLMTEKELKYIISNQRIDLNKKLPPIPWLKILKSVPFWTYVVPQTCQDWSFYTLMTDLPTFFATILHFKIEKNGFYSSFPHLLQSVVGLTVAMVADWIARKGYASTTFVRKFCNSVSGFASALAFIGVCLSGCNVTLNVVFFMSCIAITGFVFSGHTLTLLDISPEYAGTLTGVSNTISSLTGFLAPLYVGALTDEKQTLHQWRIVFGTASAALMFASFFFVIFATAEKQDWVTQEAADPILNNPKDSEVKRSKYDSIN